MSVSDYPVKVLSRELLMKFAWHGVVFRVVLGTI